MAGTIDNATMVEYLNEGFAVAAGDSGHLASENNDGEGAPNTYLPYLHDRDQVLAWIHNSIALFTPPARDFVKAHYAHEPAYSYYYGCSTGGAQGFALSQLHPDLFDGIYAGCPGFWYSHLALSFLWNGQQTKVGFYNAREKAKRIADQIRATHIWTNRCWTPLRRRFWISAMDSTV